MLITSSFVYLHQPRTGGTFVADVLASIQERRGLPLRVVHASADQAAQFDDVPEREAVRLLLDGRKQHGARRDIPPQYRNRAVVATVRHPFDRYVSQFEFAWWRVDPAMFGPVDQVRALYPAFPELSFDQFVRLVNARAPRGLDPTDLPGWHTQEFIEYFFRDPDAGFAMLADEAALRALWAQEMAGVSFLRQQSLNEDLARFLVQHGYTEAEVAWVRQAGRVRPAPDDADVRGWARSFQSTLGIYVGRGEADPAPHLDWQKYFTPELRAFVRRKERLIFEQFPEFKA